MTVQLFPFLPKVKTSASTYNQRLPQPKRKKKNNAKEYTVNRDLAPQTMGYSTIFLPGIGPYPRRMLRRLADTLEVVRVSSGVGC